MMKIFQRPQAIVMIVASALYLLLSVLSITNPVIILFSLACVMAALWIAIPASLHRVSESHVDVVAITFPTTATDYCLWAGFTADSLSCAIDDAHRILS
jgi:hypothetical protein